MEVKIQSTNTESTFNITITITFKCYYEIKKNWNQYLTTFYMILDATILHNSQQFAGVRDIWNFPVNIAISDLRPVSNERSGNFSFYNDIH